MLRTLQFSANDARQC